MSLVIPGELYSSKNSRQPRLVKARSGKTRIMNVKSEAAERHFRKLLWLLADAGRRKAWDDMVAGKAYPLTVRFKVYRRTHGRFDYTNILQNLLDAMVSSGYLPDDDARHLIPIPLPYEKDADNPRTVITVV